MLSNIIIGKFYDTNSMIHNMNPIVKIICTIIFAIFSFLSYNFYVNLIIFILLTLLILLSKIPLRFYFKSIYFIKWFLLFIFVINLIFEKNLYMSFILTLRVVYVSLYTMMILYTTKQDDIIYGLQKVFSPLKLIKIPIDRMAFSIGLALRFIPNLIYSFERILKSQINRGIYYKELNLRDKISLISSMMTSIFTLSIKKADMLSESMEIRLYDFDNYNIKKKISFNYFDFMIILIHITLLILVIRKGVFI